MWNHQIADHRDRQIAVWCNPSLISYKIRWLRPRTVPLVIIKTRFFLGLFFISFCCKTHPWAGRHLSWLLTPLVSCKTNVLLIATHGHNSCNIGSKAGQMLCCPGRKCDSPFLAKRSSNWSSSITAFGRACKVSCHFEEVQASSSLAVIISLRMCSKCQFRK